MQISPKIILFLLILLVTGCVGVPVKPSYSPLLEERIVQLVGMSEWVIDGRLAIKNGDDGLSTSMHWAQNHHQFEISLLDPLGRKVAYLTGTNETVSLTTADGKKIEGADPEMLQMRYLGWALPLNHLADWVRGLPAQTVSMQDDSYDGVGRLKALTQAGWRIQFKRYETAQLVAWPQLVILEKGDFRAKLLIDNRI